MCKLQNTSILHVDCKIMDVHVQIELIFMRYVKPVECLRKRGKNPEHVI